MAGYGESPVCEPARVDEAGFAKAILGIATFSQQPAPQTLARDLCESSTSVRKLVVIAHLMLKNNEPYRYALPETTRGKLADLWVAATGERRKKSGPLREPMQRRAPGSAGTQDAGT